MRAVAFACFALVLACASCGRTPEARTAYPCLADLTANCESLEEQRENLENTYQAEAAKDAPDPVRADDIAVCSRTVVEQQLTLKCFDDRCATLCELHPCDIQGGLDCDAACDDVVDAEEIPLASLEASILAASERPGFCTCQVCDDVTQPLCADVFVCP